MVPLLVHFDSLEKKVEKFHAAQTAVLRLPLSSASDTCLFAASRTSDDAICVCSPGTSCITLFNKSVTFVPCQIGWRIVWFLVKHWFEILFCISDAHYLKFPHIRYPEILYETNVNWLHKGNLDNYLTSGVSKTKQFCVGMTYFMCHHTQLFIIFVHGGNKIRTGTKGPLYTTKTLFKNNL